MAEKQFALGGNRNASYLEDDDPLAELARIVGFQEQPAVQPRAAADPVVERRETVVAEFPAAAPPAPDAAPHNPVADLEDELLRAFETYDAPRISGQSSSDGVPSVDLPSPFYQHQAPTVAREPAVPALTAQQAELVTQAQPVSLDDEDPFDALAAVVAASAPEVSPAVMEPQAVYAAEPAVTPPAAPVRPPMRSLATPLLPQAPKPAEIEVPAPAAVAAEPEFSVDLLEEELLQSLDEAVGNDVSSAAMQPEPVHAEPARQAFAEPAPEIAPDLIDETDIDWDFPGIDADDMVTLDPPHASEASVALRPAAEPITADRSMDALLDDVARYAVPSARVDAPQRREPAFDDALAAISGVATDIDPMARRAPAPAPIAAAPSVPAMASPVEVDPDFGDFFTPTDFELDIDELEQQLTDLEFTDSTVSDHAGPASEPVLVSAPAEDTRHLEAFADFVPESRAEETYVADEPYVAENPYLPEDVYQQPVRHAFVEPVRAPSAPEPVYTPAPAVMAMTAAAVAHLAFEPSYRAPQPVVPDLDVGVDGNGQFDPAMLSEAEDPIETLSEIDVPELEVQAPEEPVAIEPDYDLDIDAEMATLFANLPEEPAQPAARDDEQAFSSAFVASGSRAAASTETFDEFEKALEDDFRNMLSQPLGQPRSLAGAPVQAMPAYAAKKGNGGRTLKTILLAACATGVIALVGLGGYLVIGHAGNSSTGTPRIITADKGPVKVVPENKGGVTVPNQDKAVYDRVAGHEADDVKQGSLVTTEEQPVDVVQKTLSADASLPGDGDQPQDVAMATPVEDTRDARLLPADAQPAAADGTTASAVSATPGGVAVRKVRTMIVKPDGTLVPREDSPAEDAATAAAATDAQPRTDDTASAPLAAGAPVATADQDLRITGATTNTAPAVPASTDALASVANSNVAEAPPVQVVKTTAAVSDKAPIPTARPSDQPVNVVGTVTERGNVKANEPAQETASIDQPAAAAASAPPSGSYGIQIASLPSEADAKASIKKFAAKFSGVIGGRSIGIRQADIPGKGTYYRLRVDVGSKDQAIALCTKLKAAGGSCLVSK